MESTESEDVADVVEAVRSLASLWQILALKLRLKEDSIEKIWSKYTGYSLMCLTEVIREWLRKNHDMKKHGPPSWRVLVKAVMGLDNRLAYKIASEHGKTDSFLDKIVSPYYYF